MKLAVSLLLMSYAGFAAEQTWTGQVSDSMCGVYHKAMASGGKTVNTRDCTLACTNSGSKLASVSKGKVFDIANQNFSDLTKHAGQSVTLTNELASDGKTITVSKLVATKQ